jgi:hypothetical protein
MAALGERWRAEGGAAAAAVAAATRGAASADEENLCSNLRTMLDLAAGPDA